MDYKHPGLEDLGEGNSIFVHSTAKIELSTKISFKGNGHSLRIGENVTLRNISINFSGENNNVEIGAGCNLRGSIHIRQKGSHVVVGEGTTFVGAHLFAMEGKRIEIGSGCMFSSGIYIRTSDEHPVFDIVSGMRINEAANITVGRKVWLGEGVTLGKGAIIPSGCVLGAKSYVAKRLSRENSIYAGTPARLVREGVCWSRKL